MVYVKAGPAAKAGPVAKVGPSRHFGGSADPFDPPPWLRPCFELPVAFFDSIWKDTGNTQGLMSRILKDVAYCIGIFLSDLVDSGSCRLFVV